ncbi:MAG: DUF4350 domain-containing protein [Candidatus Heimdallarchaeaceae archaeon]
MSILFMIVVVPIFLGLVGLGGYGTKFSIYSDSWDGLSSVRQVLENDGFTNITNGMSSLSLLNRVYEPGVFAIIGPATQYSTTDTISLITFLARGGSLLVADDYGTGAEIFEPLFNIINTWDQIAMMQGGIPTLAELFGFGEEGGGVTEETIFFELLGMMKGFAFNGSVLMDAESYTVNPAQPILTPAVSTPLTSGVDRLQMEFGTALSVAINHTFFLDEAETVKAYRTDWMPLQAINLLEHLGIDAGYFFLPFLPFYTTESSWLESDFQSAKDGTATPDADEWGNAMFAPIMTLPIGRGKIVMIGDPDIFINKWIDKTTENDNAQFSINLFNYLTADMNTTDPKSVPIIFDEGHAHQKFYSATVYSMVLMRFITEMSMFPLYAPFIPIIFAILGYRLIPKKTRLTPILWTKYRGEKGRSRFEREIRRIVDTGAYSEAVGLLYRTMLRGLRKVTKQSMSSPQEIADYFSERDPSLRQKDLLDTLIRIDAYLAKPRIIPEHMFMKYMTFIKSLIDRLPGS